MRSRSRYRGKHVIQQHHVSTSVHCPRKGDPSLLPARHVHAFFTDQRLVAVRELREISLQRAGIYCLPVPLLFKRQPEENI